ncbi:prepilin peptidase [Georgenia faecalis]|uniref:Prepilin peptidase n=1 Tax=Georgenia faecalis TaxID=2483799 RepID=A0ABV9D810_9MICO|nr:prepilin peptidase [Georgenia faecalis]
MGDGGTWVLLLAAATAGAAAAALTPRLRLIARTDSPWLRAPLHVVLAGLGGAGALALAPGWAEALTFAALAVGGAMLVVVDLAEHRLPDAVVGPMAVVLAVGLTLAAATQGEWGSLARAALAGLVLGGAYLVLALASPASLGLGDVKLAAVLGAFLGWLGWWHLTVGALAAFVLGGVVALVLLAAGRATRHSSVAFGPWMIAGAAVGAAWGPALAGV